MLPYGRPFVRKFTKSEAALTTKPESYVSPESPDETASEASRALRERARTAIARQPTRMTTVLSSLLVAQDSIGYLPIEAIEEVAKRNAASVNEVWGVASFYPNFRFTEPARHGIELCWGPTCHVLGAQPILHALLERLGLENEGDTEDGAISLKLNTCLGVCPHGPAMSFDHELAGRLTLDQAIRRVELLKAEDMEEQRAAAIRKQAEEERIERVAQAAERAAARAARVAAEAEAASAESRAAEEAQAAVQAREAEVARAIAELHAGVAARSAALAQVTPTAQAEATEAAPDAPVAVTPVDAEPTEPVDEIAAPPANEDVVDAEPPPTDTPSNDDFAQSADAVEVVETPIAAADVTADSEAPTVDIAIDDDSAEAVDETETSLAADDVALDVETSSAEAPVDDTGEEAKSND
jgi:NADH:ubiquinone oxidoreductase subunit E